MDRIIQELRQWLARHDLLRDGVELRLVMPDERAAYDARVAFRRDLPRDLFPTSLQEVQSLNAGEAEIAGIRLCIVAAEASR